LSDDVDTSVRRRVIAIRVLAWAGGIALAGVCAAAACALYVSQQTKSGRYTNIGDVPPVRVAIVFGAGLEEDKSPSGMLADRLDAAIALHRAGKVQQLLLTGDHSREDYDEVDAMRRYVLARGIPATDLVSDFAGFRTYDSCYRAHSIFGVEKAVLITQRYHMPRALYTCRRLGIDAIGLATADWGKYSDGMMRAYTAREWLASAVALWRVNVTHPPPRFLGNVERTP